jgi:hypothetical protein
MIGHRLVLFTPAAVKIAASCALLCRARVSAFAHNEPAIAGLSSDASGWNPPSASSCCNASFTIVLRAADSWPGATIASGTAIPWVLISTSNASHPFGPTTPDNRCRR